MDPVRKSRLPIPIIDDRRFQDILDQVLRLVEQRCPEWTPWEPGDPGIAVLEAFAFMFDNLLYKLNQVPDAMYSHFLDMVGIRTAPAMAATVPVDFYFVEPVATTIPAGTEVSTLRRETGEPVVFTTTREVRAVGAWLIDADEASDGRTWAFGLEDAVPKAILRIVADVTDVASEPVKPGWEFNLAWEYGVADGWRAADVLFDGTGGLQHGGEVVLVIGPDHEPATVGGRHAAWVRVRSVDADHAIPATAIGLSEVSTVGVRTEACHRRLVDGEELGRSDGRPGQQFNLASTPVLPSVEGERILVGGEVWLGVDSMAESSPDGPHYELDATGVIRFGDGRHGRVPERGAPIVARYWHGGGAVGNVGGGTLTVLRSPVPNVNRVENRVRAHGGCDAEPVEQARGRAPGLLRSSGRAVTVEDFEVLAVEADPAVARARCIPPAAPGAPVRVFLVPKTWGSPDELDPSELVPDDRCCAQVAAYLDERRVVGTKVLVTPPLYQGVRVAATLQVAPRADPGTVSKHAAVALSTYLHPIQGGRAGHGWPFGRAVVAGELFGVLLDVSGVDMVDEVLLWPWDLLTGDVGTTTERIDLPPDGLVLADRPMLHVR